MATYPSVAGGGLALPIKVPDNGILAESAIDQGSFTIGAATPNRINNIELAFTNILRLNLGGWMVSGAGAVVRHSKIGNATGANEVATVGAAGGAAALPATPLGYLIIQNAAGTDVKLPFYNP